MTADRVVDEGGRVGRGLADFAVGDEAGFDQCLEAVADAEDESVAMMDQVHDCFGDFRAADDGSDEFCRAIGFVAGAESAGEHEDLALADFCGECIEGFADVLLA